MIKKYRVIPRGFGGYFHKKAIETEAVYIATSTISVEEYYKIRGLHFVVDSFYNTRLLREIVLYLRSLNNKLARRAVWRVHNDGLLR